MIQDLPVRNSPIIPFKFKRHFEAQQNRVRVFGPCEVTGRNFELYIPTEEFFIYTQGFKDLEQALKSLSQQERHFIATGVSPEAQKPSQ